MEQDLQGWFEANEVRSFVSPKELTSNFFNNKCCKEHEITRKKDEVSDNCTVF